MQKAQALPDCAPYPDIAHASAVLHQSMEVVARAVTGVRDGTYARSSALFDRAERSLEVCLHPYTSFEFALHDLTLLDGTMARLAELMGLAITDYDTVGIGNDPADLTIDEVTVTHGSNPAMASSSSGSVRSGSGSSGKNSSYSSSASATPVMPHLLIGRFRFRIPRGARWEKRN